MSLPTIIILLEDSSSSCIMLTVICKTFISVEEHLSPVIILGLKMVMQVAVLVFMIMECPLLVYHHVIYLLSFKDLGNSK